jgi:hypothetical protein
VTDTPKGPGAEVPGDPLTLTERHAVSRAAFLEPSFTWPAPLDQIAAITADVINGHLDPRFGIDRIGSLLRELRGSLKMLVRARVALTDLVTHPPIEDEAPTVVERPAARELAETVADRTGVDVRGTIAAQTRLGVELLNRANTAEAELQRTRATLAEHVDENLELHRRVDELNRQLRQREADLAKLEQRVEGIERSVGG